MKFFALLGIVLTALIALGSIYLYSGAYDVAATTPHTDFVRWSLNRIQMSSIQHHADTGGPPAGPDQPNRLHGVEHFHEMCATCHGAPGVPPSEIGKGLNPAPPQLTDVAEALTESELFWTVKNGIKMTGMPAFGPTHGDEEIWDIVAFLEHLPEVSSSEYQRMLEDAGIAGGESHEHSAADASHGDH